MKQHYNQKEQKQPIYLGGICSNEYWQQFQNKR